MASPAASPLTPTSSYTAVIFFNMPQRCINKQQTLLHLHTMQQVTFSIAMATMYNSLQISPSTVNLLRHLARLYTSIAALSRFLRPLRDHSSCLGSSQPPIAYAHASDLALVTMQRSHAISNRYAHERRTGDTNENYMTSQPQHHDNIM